MRTIFTMLLMAVTAIETLTAEGAGFAFEVAASLGIEGARSEELVFEKDSLLSRLDWQDQAAFAAHISAAVMWRRFFIAGDIRCSFIGGGIMEDYDYLEQEDIGQPNRKASLYSRHESDIKKTFDGAVEIGYRLNIERVKTVFPFSAGVWFRQRAWSAHDGFLQYPETGPWMGNEPKEYVRGTLIEYDQNIFFPYIRVGHEHQIKRGLIKEFGLSYRFAPYIWAQTMDQHKMRNVRFYDQMEGGFLYACEATIDFLPNFGSSKLFSNGIYAKSSFLIALRLRAGFEVLTGARGPSASGTISGEDSQTLWLDDNVRGGIERFSWFCTLGIVFARE